MTYRDNRVAVLTAAYNEGSQIGQVLKAIPDFVDHVVVVNDASQDDTAAVVEAVAAGDPRVALIDLDSNVGVGGALAHAYRWARDSEVDIAVSIDADGQMDLEEMTLLLDPIVDGKADYTKGNRLFDPRGWATIPRIRLMGNAILSLLTKIASGYWSVADSQSGYSAAGRVALKRIDWDSMYARYGRPNDVLVLANVAECRVADIPVRPVYGVGEQSSMKIAKVIVTISLLLFRRFWWRMSRKYLLRDFHPLLLFYLLATATTVISLFLSVRLVVLWIQNGNVPQMTALALSFFTITSLNAAFFASWMDMQANSHLAVKLPSDWPSRHREQPPAPE